MCNILVYMDTIHWYIILPYLFITFSWVHYIAFQYTCTIHMGIWCCQICTDMFSCIIHYTCVQYVITHKHYTWVYHLTIYPMHLGTLSYNVCTLHTAKSKLFLTPTFVLKHLLIEWSLTLSWPLVDLSRSNCTCSLESAILPLYKLFTQIYQKGHFDAWPFGQNVKVTGQKHQISPWTTYRTFLSYFSKFDILSLPWHVDLSDDLFKVTRSYYISKVL